LVVIKTSHDKPAVYEKVKFGCKLQKKENGIFWAVTPRPW
jgi:hypothetical protein